MRWILAAVALFLPLCSAAAQTPAEDAARARLMFEQKQYAEAAALLEKVQRVRSLGPEDLAVLGTCYTQLGELDKAQTVLDSATLMAPDSVPVLNARGNLAFARKRFADAVAAFRKANRLDPQDRNAVAGLVASLSNYGVELFGKGSIDDARKAFREATQLDPRSLPALRNIAILELEKGDPSAAVQYLEQGLAIAPKDVGLLKLLFLVRNRQSDTAAMLPILDRLIEVQPADPEPYAVEGRLLEQQGKKEQALDVFRQAVEKGSQDPLPYLRVGEERKDRYALQEAIGKAVQLISALQIGASQTLGSAKKAEDLQGAKLLTAKIEDVRTTLTTSLSLLREIDGDSVFAEDLARLQSWYPGSVDLLAALGRLNQEKGRWQEALAAWQDILKDHPLDGEAQAGAGLAFEKLGDRDQAVAAYRRAREIQPQSKGIYAALERVYAGREDELREVLLDISYRETRNPVLFRELAKIEAGLGQQADADRHLARAVEIESGK